MPANSSPGRRLSASTILSLAAFVLGCGSPGNTGPSPSVRVMPGSQALALPAGGSGGTSLTISRGNFNGPVRLAVGILPTGVSASFDPEVVAESSSSVTFNAIANAIPGTYDVLVRATGGGVPDAELTLSITVAAPSFILTSEVDAVTLASGTSAAVPVKAFRLGGFNGVISYA
ncbi:MAG: hypothetical protein ABJE47_24255, partial [bacterium]